MSIKIITNNLRGRQPLYYKYANEFKPQPAYISLHEDGDVIADSCIEINSTPEDVYHHRRLRFDISNSAAKGKLCKFLKSPEIVEIFKRIHAGHHVDWNGHDMVGTHSGRTDSFQPAGASYPHRVSALIH